MDDLDLSPELRELERALAARPRPAPPAELRDRVIGQMQVGLRRNGPRSRWSFVAAVAVAAAVWINLSLSATLTTDFDRRSHGAASPVGQVAEEIRLLLPELSENEALRQAVMLRATSNMPPAVPWPKAPPTYCLLDDMNNPLLQGD
jgi:hypothetical protein